MITRQQSTKKDTTSTAKVAKKKNKSEKKVTKKESSHQEELDTMVEAAKSQIPNIKKQQGNLYSDVTVASGKNDTIIYTYILKNKVPSLDSEALKPTLIKQVKPAMSMVTGEIPDIKMQFIYLNPDKSEVANITVTKDDIDKLDDSSNTSSTSN